MGFTEATHRNRHMRVSCKIAPNDKNGEKGMERLYDYTVQKQLADQKAEITEMKAMMETQNQMMQQLLNRQNSSLWPRGRYRLVRSRSRETARRSTTARRSSSTSSAGRSSTT